MESLMTWTVDDLSCVSTVNHLGGGVRVILSHHNMIALIHPIHVPTHVCTYYRCWISFIINREALNMSTDDRAFDVMYLTRLRFDRLFKSVKCILLLYDILQPISSHIAWTIKDLTSYIQSPLFWFRENGWRKSFNFYRIIFSMQKGVDLAFCRIFPDLFWEVAKLKIKKLIYRVHAPLMLATKTVAVRRPTLTFKGLLWLGQNQDWPWTSDSCKQPVRNPSPQHRPIWHSL